MPKVSRAIVFYSALTGSTERGTPFFTTTISVRCPRAAAKNNAAPAMSTAIVKGGRLPMEDGYGTRMADKERFSVPSKRTFWSDQRRGIAESAPIPQTGAGGDAIGTQPLTLLHILERRQRGP